MKDKSALPRIYIKKKKRNVETLYYSYYKYVVPQNDKYFQTWRKNAEIKVKWMLCCSATSQCIYLIRKIPDQLPCCLPTTYVCAALTAHKFFAVCQALLLLWAGSGRFEPAIQGLLAATATAKADSCLTWVKRGSGPYIMYMMGVIAFTLVPSLCYSLAAFKPLISYQQCPVSCALPNSIWLIPSHGRMGENGWCEE